MQSRFGILVVIRVVMTSLAGTALAQNKDQVWKRALTLPNGEVILDMRGDWDGLSEFKGMYSGLRSDRNIVTITQDGNVFTGVRKTSDEWHSVGAEVLKGELDKTGSKTVNVKRADVGWVPCKWEITEGGDKIVLDDERVLQQTYTRK